MNNEFYSKYCSPLIWDQNTRGKKAQGFTGLYSIQRLQDEKLYLTVPILQVTGERAFSLTVSPQSSKYLPVANSGSADSG